MKKHLNILVVIVGFLMYYIASKYFKVTMHAINGYVGVGLLSYFITYVLVGLPILIATYIVNAKTNIFRTLGLGANAIKALIVALVITLPMFAGGAILYKLQEVQSIPQLIAKTIFAGFFEELYFRAFLFGLLFRYTKLGFIPAVILGAIVFAIGHIYQSDVASIQVGIFLTTFLGAGYFSWLYAEWKYNAWVPIFIHTFMNLSWMMYDMSSHAMGGTLSNILRALTIAIAIAGTIIYKKKQGEPLTVNKRTLLWHKEG